MWTSTLELSIKKIVSTQILGMVWRGAYFSSLAPLQVHNLPRQALTSHQGNWVRVHNRLAGICGSDLHLVFANGDPRIAPAALPTHQGSSYPGHEVIGEVIEIGDQVQNLQAGDRVVLQSGPNCLTAGVQPPCDACATGNYSLCSKGALSSPQQIGGGWSEEMLVHEQQLFRIPPEMEDEQAVLLEPTAVAVHAVLRRLPRAGEKVLIVGSGTIGLLILQVIRALAPQAEVTVMARHSFQVEQATRMGAAHILYGSDNYSSIEKATGGKLYQGMLGNRMLLGGYDVIFDSVSSRQTTHDCLRWARARGTVVMVGVYLRPMQIDLSPIWYQEVNLIGSMAHGTEEWPAGSGHERSTFAIASDLITNRLLHPEKLITHRFALSNFRDALQTASDKKNSRAIKVVFDALLLPASSVPTTRPAAYTRLPRLNFSPGQAQSSSPDTSSLPPLTPVAQSAPSTGPSHFTMAQSEDFTADFDNAQFVPSKPQPVANFDNEQFIAPKPQRPPTPLLFRPTDDLPQTPQPIGPSTVINTPSRTLQQTGGPDDNPMAVRSSE
ncbi:MAG TPA: alcohol dehydrogenase catalytic domain-containing protein [Ktedonobacteraceae bacterium]